MPISRNAGRSDGLRSAAALLVLAGALVGAGFWLSGRAAAQRSHDSIARSARIRADAARRVSRHPSAKYVVRQAVASGQFGPMQEAGIRKALDAVATRYSSHVRATTLDRSYARFLASLVSASFKDQPQKWQADLNTYANRLENEANASRPLPAWVAPYTSFLPFAAWGIAALLGLLGVLRLIAARPSLRLPSLRLPSLPTRQPGAVAEKSVTAAPAPGTATATVARLTDPAAVAVAAAVAVEAVRADYEEQVERLRNERNEARRHLLILKGRLEKGESGTVAAAPAPSVSETEAMREERDQKETLERHLQILQAHVTELEEAFRQADFRAQTAEMRASQLTGEVTDLEETLFLRAAELREARALLEEMRCTVSSIPSPAVSTSLPEIVTPEGESDPAEAEESITFDLRDILGGKVTFDASAYDLSTANPDFVTDGGAGKPQGAAAPGPDAEPARASGGHVRTPRTRAAAARLTVAAEPHIAEAAAKGGTRARSSHHAEPSATNGDSKGKADVGERQEQAPAASLPQSTDAPPPSLGAFPPRPAAYPTPNSPS